MFIDFECPGVQGYICSNVETIEGRGKRVVDIMAPWLAEWERRNKAPQVSFAHHICIIVSLI
jgi:hypothetical protein